MQQKNDQASNIETIEVSKSTEQKSRRNALRNIAVTGAGLGSVHALATKWKTPIIESVILPAHAQTSTEEPVVEPPAFSCQNPNPGPFVLPGFTKDCSDLPNGATTTCEYYAYVLNDTDPENTQVDTTITTSCGPDNGPAQGFIIRTDQSEFGAQLGFGVDGAFESSGFSIGDFFSSTECGFRGNFTGAAQADLSFDFTSLSCGHTYRATFNVTTSTTGFLYTVSDITITLVPL